MHIYPNVIAAVASAYAAPREHTRGTLGAVTGRDHDALTSQERIAQAGMVQQIANAHCSPRAVMVFRAIWEDEAGPAAEAIEWLARQFRRPGRAPPKEWGVAVVLYWAGRPKTRSPSDTAWAKLLQVDRRTVGAWRRELRQSLEISRREGLKIMSEELRRRGLIPGDA